MKTILVTVDSLRADHLNQYGYERDTMPVLDRLTDEGTVFENAFANGAYTRISIPAFQTSQHLAYQQLKQLPTIASILSDEGIDTAVIGTQTGIGLVDGEFKFDETIDLGRDEFHKEANHDRPLSERIKYQINRPATKLSQWLQGSGMDQLYESLKRPYNRLFADSGFRYLGYTSAEQVTDRALSWVNSHADTDFFLWIHYMEGHRPYGIHDTEQVYCKSTVDVDRVKELMKKAGTRPNQVSKAERELMIDLYDSDLRYCSCHLERLFDGLERVGIWEESNVVFSSDHGEEFFEHGEFFHRNYPYDGLSHVPLMVKSPALDTVERITGVRELLDLAPTICSFHLPNLEIPTFKGTHLLEGSSRTVFSLGQPKNIQPSVAIRTEDWKYITNGDGDEELFNLKADPREQEDCSDALQEKVEELRAEIPTNLIERKIEQPRSPKNEVDREHLEALGYIELRD